jgi:hypothetical protein
VTHPARPKRVLAVRFSQTGQLHRISEHLLAPLREGPGIELHVETLRPAHDYPFPWPFLRFFDTFPETVHGDPVALRPLGLSERDAPFDLVIVFYQVWFLAPSPPVTAFLKDPLAAKLLAGTPVVTVIGCRNMWLMAQEKIKRLLEACGARLVDNVVLADSSPTLATLITTPLWLLTGRRDFIKALPAAGIAETEIARTRRFGLALRDALQRDEERGTQPLLAGLEAVEADPRLLVSEKAGTRSFHLWGKLLRAVGRQGQWRRYPVLVLYVLFLVALILTVVPVSLTLQWLLRPLMRGRLAAIKSRFEQPSGSGSERMHQYER